MQCLTGNELKTILHKLPVTGINSTLNDAVATISFIAENGVTDMLHVHPDLMRPSCFKFALNQGNISKTFYHFVMCYSMLAVTAIRKYIHNFSVLQTSTYITCYCTFI